MPVTAAATSASSTTRTRSTGHHGATTLDGVTFWLAGDLGAEFSDGEMDWSVLHFTPETTKAQRDAIGDILGHLFPVKWKSFEVGKDAAIEWNDSGEKPVARLDGGKAAEVVLTRFKGADNKPVVIQNLPYWGAPRNDGFIMAPNQVQAYRLGSKAYEFKGTNGFLITIDVDSNRRRRRRRRQCDGVCDGARSPLGGADARHQRFEAAAIDDGLAVLDDVRQRFAEQIERQHAGRPQLGQHLVRERHRRSGRHHVSLDGFTHRDGLVGRHADSSRDVPCTDRASWARARLAECLHRGDVIVRHHDAASDLRVRTDQVVVVAAAGSFGPHRGQPLAHDLVHGPELREVPPRNRVLRHRDAAARRRAEQAVRHPRGRVVLRRDAA